MKCAQNHGAAAILSTDLRGGNYNAQSHRAYTDVPTFNLGTKDGETIRALLTDARAGDAPHIKIRLDVAWRPNQKPYLVWGTLPGENDETIYVIAHRDGWFDAAGDNASGVASMLGLAEYSRSFSRVNAVEPWFLSARMDTTTSSPVVSPDNGRSESSGVVRRIFEFGQLCGLGE